MTSEPIDQEMFDVPSGSIPTLPTIPIPPRPSKANPIPVLDFSDIPGSVYHEESKDVIWSSYNIKTKLPWISDPDQSGRNLLENVGVLLYFYIIFFITTI
jgi:hypothetical protein